MTKNIVQNIDGVDPDPVPRLLTIVSIDDWLSESVTALPFAIVSTVSGATVCRMVSTIGSGFTG